MAQGDFHGGNMNAATRICAAIGGSAALFAGFAAPATVSPAATEPTVRAPPSGTEALRITIPMTSDEPTVNARGAKVPAKRIIGDCGIAFLYLSRVDIDVTRAVYGFEKLENRSVAYTANATFINEDTDHVETDGASGPLRFRTSYQREATRWTGSGTVTVYAHLTAQKWKGGTCSSVPGLNEQIFLY